MDEQGREAIISGIKDEAAKKADEIIKSAELQIRERLAAWEEQKQSQLRDAAREAESRAAAAARIARSRREVEQRRNRLKAHEQLISQLTAEIRSDLACRVNDPSYPEILKGWIVEAALGLSLPELLVQTSSQEAPLISAKLLRESEERIYEITGRKVKLELDTDAALPAQGVVLVAREGSVAYRNQVPVRMERFQSRIRHLIYEHLFKED